MGSTGDGQKAGERAEHAWAVLILHNWELLEANSAAWEFFKLSFTYQLSLCFFYVVHYVFEEWGSLSSFTAQHCSIRCKKGSCNHKFP